jgi:hypothetical protein
MDDVVCGIGYDGNGGEEVSWGREDRRVDFRVEIVLCRG